MSGKGKGKGKGGKSVYPGSGQSRVSSSEKAGLQFPVARIRRFLKIQHDRKRVTVSSAVYLAAVLEYLMAELLELAGNCANDMGRKNITPRHILLAIKNDNEGVFLSPCRVDQLLKKVIIFDGGVLPFIHPQLIPEGKGKKKAGSQEA
ncbi:histone-fold-containing protein [Mycena haematopus]|nr:histone-fold-containing protein [Mycena haematopus]